MGDVTLKSIFEALATAIESVLGANVPVYPSAAMQVELPCVVIAFITPSGIEYERIGSTLRKLSVDLNYLSDYNVPDLFLEYADIADKFDAAFELLKYTDAAGNQMLIWTYDRTWNYDRSGMHYKFSLEFSMRRFPDASKMQRIATLEAVLRENTTLERRST